MESILSAFLAFGSFVFGFFGTPIPPESPAYVAPAEVVATTTVATTTPIIIDRPKPKPTWVPVPAPSIAPEPIVPVSVPATMTATTTSTRSSGGSNATGLTISGGSLTGVAEKDTISFTALYGNEDVTARATWEVLGPIGSVSKGVFTAKLDATYAEFGHAPGAVIARYKDPVSKKELFAESAIFEVEAYIPEDTEIGGQ